MAVAAQRHKRETEELTLEIKVALLLLLASPSSAAFVASKIEDQ